MTPQEIQERNKQIALMLGKYADGWSSNSLDPMYEFPKKYTVGDNFATYCHQESYLKFHLDWNWLMEAVEFIERLSVYHMVETNRSSCVIYNGKNIITANYFKADKTKKEAVFIAVSDFAKLYNEKKL